MPDQNPADPTALGAVSSFSTIGAASDPPPSMDSSDLPPAPPIVEPAPPEVPPVGDTGGATPTFDISSSISGTPPPKKKFGGKRFVATILGLLVLVGGLGAGIILVQQQQDIRERAKATECGADSDCPSGYSCKAGLCQPKSTPTPTKTPTPTRVPTPTKTPTQTPSPPPSNACTKAGGQCYTAPNCTFAVGRPPVNGGSGCGNLAQVCCQPGGVITPTPTSTPTSCQADSQCSSGQVCSNGKCVAAPSCQADSQCSSGQVCSNGKCVTPATPTPTGGGQCSRVSQVFTDHNATSITVSQAMMNACTSNCSDGKLWVSRYKCNGINLSQGCQDNGEVLTWDAKVGQTFSASNPTCGTIQVDVGCKNSANTYGNVGGVSKGAAQACSTPTTPPGPPTAQCLNVRAFDINWTELKVPELSQLKAGDKVRFTVGGTTSGGSFDKAKFKINGVERLEVTAKKPASQDFYDEYTIPEGATTFTINAQIHHATLGWSN